MNTTRAYLHNQLMNNIDNVHDQSMTLLLSIEFNENNEIDFKRTTLQAHHAYNYSIFKQFREDLQFLITVTKLN